jgi:hypothetical protein
MILATNKSMQSTLWLARIGKVEQLGSDDELLRLTLVDGHGRYTSLLLDEEAVVRHLCRAVGVFGDPAEIVDKSVLVVFGWQGDAVALYTPDENDHYEGGLYPPAPSPTVRRDKDGRVFSEVGVGPTFTP